jgi:chromosome segregation ATPase
MTDNTEAAAASPPAAKQEAENKDKARQAVIAELQEQVNNAKATAERAANVAQEAAEKAEAEKKKLEDAMAKAEQEAQAEERIREAEATVRAKHKEAFEDGFKPDNKRQKIDDEIQLYYSQKAEGWTQLTELRSIPWHMKTGTYLVVCSSCVRRSLLNLRR